MKTKVLMLLSAVSVGLCIIMGVQNFKLSKYYSAAEALLDQLEVDYGWIDGQGGDECSEYYAAKSQLIDASRN
jgi:hypothetical protein